MSVNETEAAVLQTAEPAVFPEAPPESPAAGPAADGAAQPLPDALLSQIAIDKTAFPVLNGVVGALLGSVPGILLWVVIGQFGFIAGIAGWLMIRGAIFGYTKLAGGIDRRGEVISTVVALLMPIVSEYLGLAVSVYRAFHASYGVTVDEALRTAPLYLSEPDVLRSLIFSLIIGYVLIAFGNIRAKPKQKKDAQAGPPSL